ncbi:MAG: enolase C-terminal domain-like protein [Streptosporangiaceae bacterium]
MPELNQLPPRERPVVADAPAIEDISAAVYVIPTGAAESMARAVRNIGRGGVAAMAISAVDIALWDLKARLIGRPVADLLGHARQHVPIYGSGGFTSYDEHQTSEQLSGWVDKNRIPRVKIKIGESWGSNEHRDLERVELAREVIGPDTELYVDANGGYTTGQAVRVARQLDDYGVTWFEEPVSSQDVAGLAAIRLQVAPDVAAGEYSWSLADSARLLEGGAVDCLQLDVTRCGGITEFLRGAALAAAHSMQVSGHCAPSLHAHPAAAAPAPCRVLPRPSAHRAAAVRRGARPARRGADPGLGTTGSGIAAADGGRRAVPAGVTSAARFRACQRSRAGPPASEEAT